MDGIEAIGTGDKGPWNGGSNFGSNAGRELKVGRTTPNRGRADLPVLLLQIGKDTPLLNAPNVPNRRTANCPPGPIYTCPGRKTDKTMFLSQNRPEGPGDGDPPKRRQKVGPDVSDRLYGRSIGPDLNRRKTRSFGQSPINRQTFDTLSDQRLLVSSDDSRAAARKTEALRPGQLTSEAYRARASVQDLVKDSRVAHVLPGTSWLPFEGRTR